MAHFSHSIKIAVLAICASVTAGFLTMLVSMERFGGDLREPKIEALSGFPRGDGCGVETGTSYGGSVFYLEPGARQLGWLKVNESQREAIDKELIARGFTRTSQSARVSYKMSTGGIFPVEKGVLVYADGTVECGAGRSKWPIMIAISLATGIIVFIAGSSLMTVRRSR